jgi:hypothetical protein
MDFKTVLSSLIKQFNDQNVRYGLMGGFALGLWGVARATVDLDFLIDKRDMGKVDTIMNELGYQIDFKSENVSQYRSGLKAFGEVDFVHAFRDTSVEMLERTAEKNLYGGELKIHVLVPEDIIGLKLQAIQNNPKRREIDLNDIKALASVPGNTLDWKTIERYADLLGAKALIDEVRKGN